MNDLSTDQFADYFQALHGTYPYSWQSRLAALAINGNWPAAIDLPTGSGKTACIDIAVFALACQARRKFAERTAPRRIFFCVNRRVIVDEAHQRAQRIAKRLWQAEKEKISPILCDVAAALRLLAGTIETDDAPPLDVLELRGGIYRDNRWARSATQPTVICTTIDQLGSRLLFRGYGVSPNAAPLQAALVAYDSLVLLDEAHISQPFGESLGAVRRYLDPETWAEQPVGVKPMIFVPMTATPPKIDKPDDVIQLDEKDRANESLAARLAAQKRAQLLMIADLPNAIVEQARRHAETPKAVGIIVNRIATAKQIYEDLRENYPDANVELVIGSMRPIDRDEQATRIGPLVGPCRPEVAEKTSFTVATQCLEVGADYDFDVLFTECASLDALRQRFGRLNRSGRPIDSRAVILVKNKDIKSDDALEEDKPIDPVYGNALSRTWNWLWSHANVIPPETPPSDGESTSRPTNKSKAATRTETREIDFGIDAFNALLEEHTGARRIPGCLLAPSANLHAPVMLPAYVDFWCQTSPLPVPDPDVALFIHGPQGGEPDVQVCWRADLMENDEKHWCDIVSLLPPTAAECMSVPISRVRRWLAGRRDTPPEASDLLEVKDAEEDGDSRTRDRNGRERSVSEPGVLWRGVKETKLVASPTDLRPGDVLILPAHEKVWNVLGHIPLTERSAESSSDAADSAERTDAEHAHKVDLAEAAFQAAKDKVVLRLHPTLRFLLPKNAATDLLFERATDVDVDDVLTKTKLRGLLNDAADSLTEQDGPLHERLKHLARGGVICEPYPDRRGMVVTARKRLGSVTSWFLPPLDDGEDDSSRLGRETPVTLDDHTEHVTKALSDIVSLLPMNVSADAFLMAAKLHDWGKADERFQAMLLRSDRTDGQIPPLLAKSDGLAQSPSERHAARIRAELPDRFRHEMFSVQLAERFAELPRDGADRDLILHLIASHHGYGRPFAPVVLDDKPPDVDIAGVSLSAAERLERPPHRLDSGIAERFWLLTHRFGWWGLAYFEALLRLADQQASADEDSGKHDEKTTSQPAEASA